jgi:hypothetical protein
MAPSALPAEHRDETLDGANKTGRNMYGDDTQECGII